MNDRHPVEMLPGLAAAGGGKVEEVARLPDGSGFGILTFPLPKDHWLYAEGRNVPPMPMRLGVGEERDRLVAQIRAAGRYAVRASTDNGRFDDYDPDAMVGNFVVGLLGYWTPTGLSEESEANPPGAS